MTYHNSFLVADPREAYVVETAGRHWATERVTSGSRSISNGLTIPDFAAKFARSAKGAVIGCDVRRFRTEHATSLATGPLDLMTALRDHGATSAPSWSPLHGGLHAACVHAGGVVASSQTTGSLVADLRNEPQLWATGTSAPCTSLFKPIDVGSPSPLTASATERYDSSSMWWRHERLHRAVLVDFESRLGSFVDERDQVQAAWLASAPDTASAVEQADELEERWLRDLPPAGNDTRPSYARWRWDALNAAAAMPA
jgi:dipeptidase